MDDAAHAQAIRAIEATLDGLGLCNPFFALGEETPLAHDDSVPCGFEACGRYLCETCFDVMTDTVCPAASSPTSQEQAECAACAARRLAAEEAP